MNLPPKTSRRLGHTAVAADFSFQRFSFQHFSFTDAPFSPPSGSVNGSFNGPHLKSNFLALVKYTQITILLLSPVFSLNAATIINPGFESVGSYSIFSAPDSFAGWTVSTGVVGLPLSSLGGPQAGKQVLVPAFTVSSGTSTLTQMISGLSIGTTYLLSFYTSAYSSTSYFGTSTGNVLLGSASTSFSYVVPAQNRTFGSVASPWILRSLSYVSKATEANITISVSHEDFDPYIGFDSFSLVAVPEPSTVSFLFISGAAVLLRRRNRRINQRV